MRAKFTVTKNEGGELHAAPVYTGSPENERFFEATPGGSLLLGVARPGILDPFPVGAEIYIDISLASAKPPSQPA